MQEGRVKQGGGQPSCAQKEVEGDERGREAGRREGCGMGMLGKKWELKNEVKMRQIGVQQQMCM